MPATAIGFIVGVVWTIVQFLLAEGLYQVANAMDEASDYSADTDAMHEASELVSWPAGDIYDSRYEGLIEENLAQVADIAVDPEVREQAQVLLKDIREGVSSEDYDPYWDADDLMAELDIYVVVPTTEEYAIYLGTCVVWGIVAGGIVTLLIALSRRSDTEQRLPPVINSLG